MIKALNSRVLVKVEDSKEVSVGGIIMPVTAASQDVGEVVSVGRDCDIAYEVGEKVLLPHYGCNELIDNGIKYYVLYASDILGVIR